MEAEMDTSPGYLDPEDRRRREQFRRYGKRQSGSSLSPHHDNSASRFRNAALFLEDIKHEVESLDTDHGGVLLESASKRKASIESHELSGLDISADTIHGRGSESLKICKQEDVGIESGDNMIPLFASLLDITLQGLIPIPDLILKFESSCRNVSESIRYGSNERYRIIEDKLMRQKSRLLLDEAATWSLLWYLYGKGNEELPENLIMFPTTSHLEACQYVAANHTTQLCLRIVHWLEGLASKALDLDNEVRGSHVGTYLPSSGVWHQTQRHLKKGAFNPKIVHHLDFDAPTREHAHQLPDDKKQDESLMEDVWTLLRAGRQEEASNLCRSAGQPWRAATLCPFGGLSLFPSYEALWKNGKDRMLQAIELESGIGHQLRLWKWASYCASEKIADQEGGKYERAVFASQCSNLKRILPVCTDWESACWAIAKSWLDAQVDIAIAHVQPGGMDQFKSFGEVMERSPDQGDVASRTIGGPDSWPHPILNQQPRNLSSLLQKLHSSDTVNEVVVRACKEQQRQIEINLMLGDIPHLLDSIWSWISPSEDDPNMFRPHGDPQMMRFGAHLVLVLRYLLANQMNDTFREKIMTLGDFIIQIYALFLFTKQHEELVGIYASQLAQHRCVDLFVHMMELRLNSSVHVRYKIFLSAIEYLPFSPEDDSRGSFEQIIDTVLSKSRETGIGKHVKSSDVLEQHTLHSQRKASVIQWLCFTPPSTINDAKVVAEKLVLRALMHSNLLLREFALISMWRMLIIPVGAHTVLSLLAEPLKQQMDILLSNGNCDVSENLREFQDWSEYFSCDAKYRSWLNKEIGNEEVSPLEVSKEEKQRTLAVANETLKSSLKLLRKEDNHWLVPTQDHFYESMEPLFLELHATAILCLPSGECLLPDATLCTTLTSALFSSVSKEEVLHRELMVNVVVSTSDSYCIDVVLRCLAVMSDGLGPHVLNDGGILASVMAAGFKGELTRFQAGVNMGISRLDAWYSNTDGSLEGPATYIVLGLCRKCCIPEIFLRCMQVSASLMKSGHPPEGHHELIELVTSPKTDFLHLFSQHQLQELLLLEREYYTYEMDFVEAIDY